MDDTRGIVVVDWDSHYGVVIGWIHHQARMGTIFRAQSLCAEYGLESKAVYNTLDHLVRKGVLERTDTHGEFKRIRYMSYFTSRAAIPDWLKRKQRTHDRKQFRQLTRTSKVSSRWSDRPS